MMSGRYYEMTRLNLCEMVRFLLDQAISATNGKSGKPGVAIHCRI